MRRVYFYTCLLMLLLLGWGYYQSISPTNDNGVLTAREQLDHRRIPYNRDIFLREAADGNTAVVELFLAAGMAANVRNLAHETALWKAAEHDHLDTVQVLLAHGAEVNVKDVWGITPLMKAAEYGSPPLVQVLLTNGAQVRAKDNLGNTVFQRGSARDQQELLQLLTAADTAQGQVIQQEAKP
jgi:ankyrin repeat protein